MNTKVCQRCNLERPLAEFQVRRKATGELQPWCSECMAEYKREWYALNRERHIAHVRVMRAGTSRANRVRVYTYLAEHPCADCGEADPVVLEFDHVSGEKYHEVGNMVGGGFTWEAIEREISKCVVRCVNCHRRKTAREQGIYQYKTGFRTLAEADYPYA